MRKILRSGAYEYELLGRGQSVLSFHNPESAVAFLKRLGEKSEQEGLLRELYSARCPGRHSAAPEEMVHALAGLLVRGDLKILKRFDIRGSGAVDQAQATTGPVALGQSPAKKGFIEIDLVDGDGLPVAGERYRIKLPNGSTEEGKLDAFGHAEYYGIDPGTCEWTFPDRDGTEYEKT